MLPHSVKVGRSKLAGEHLRRVRCPETVVVIRRNCGSVEGSASRNSTSFIRSPIVPLTEDDGRSSS